jgi:hypothetical protein
VTALEAAHRELSERRARLDHLDWHDQLDAAGKRERQVLAALEGVADYVKRIGDHPSSSHYRASKASPLVADAIEVLVAVFTVHAPAAAEDEIDEIGRQLRDRLAEAVHKMWELAS